MGVGSRETGATQTSNPNASVGTPIEPPRVRKSTGLTMDGDTGTTLSSPPNTRLNGYGGSLHKAKVSAKLSRIKRGRRSAAPTK